MWSWVLAIAIGIPAALLLLWIMGERGRLLLPSTKRILRAAGGWPFLTVRGWHGYLYARWPNRYIGLLIHRVFARLSPSGRIWLADRYHGKVLTPSHARAMLAVDRPIPLRDLEQIIPYPTARNLLLQADPEIVAFECPCRWASANPCRPTQVCLIIGQPFVDFVLEHHGAKARRLTRQQALQLLEEEHRRGHVHAAWFKDVCLDRFFAICNCCKCCCGGIQAMVRHGIPMMASSGYLAHVAPERCRGCARCEAACCFDAIRVNRTASVDPTRCLGCGVCVERCEAHAIQLQRDPSKGVPLDLRMLSACPVTPRESAVESTNPDRS
jgi:ferredoxin